MRTDLATGYTTIPAADSFHADRVACTRLGAPIHTRLHLNEALAHGAVVWKTVEDHYGPGECPSLPVPAGHTLIVFDDDSDVTVPADAALYVHQS